MLIWTASSKLKYTRLTYGYGICPALEWVTAMPGSALLVALHVNTARYFLLRSAYELGVAITQTIYYHIISGIVFLYWKCIGQSFGLYSYLEHPVPPFLWQLVPTQLPQAVLTVWRLIAMMKLQASCALFRIVNPNCEFPSIAIAAMPRPARKLGKRRFLGVRKQLKRQSLLPPGFFNVGYECRSQFPATG